MVITGGFDPQGGWRCRTVEFLGKLILLIRLISVSCNMEFVIHTMNKGIIKFENLFLCLE